MVSFWPWRGDDSSPSSFERTLSTVSAKITDTQSRLDKTRSNSRRVRVLWTLYLGFAYLVYAIVLLLVVGFNNMGVYEWSGVSGGPVLILATRKILSAYYNFRIESLSERLRQLQGERTRTIQKLKDATKYDSTMELIEKYGGESSSGSSNIKPSKTAPMMEDANNKESPAADQAVKPPPLPGRTSLGPPPTANINRGPDGSPMSKLNQMDPGAEFAPNAEYTRPITPTPGPPPPFLQQQQQQQAMIAPESHWYDRVFDVLLGEDETAPKNRIVLICASCRLVNGQAPPGVTSLADLGMWRCMSCGAHNGETVEDEDHRVVRVILNGEKDGEGKSDMELSVSNDEGREGQVDDGPSSVRKRRSKESK
ncbi:putative integral membrane metal-binding protein (DUF2296) [Geosmithia morbida]|uniref:Endoplasmic reticulum junction formation protein lunapark n=1 Tax=Geosmithia morbida TaxID=1094350 RepID=A0A9P4YPK5_9HYPO|nr:putative integral membrane metal-binding protein (DUF2296) [Geosmithia morbida]KAF4119454.1 putative integral membrane metal-binding protein (DUF2296) [Geosmithia morbida]